ncbi:uridine kinase [Xenococcus sp. PCC 7305]|uniref:uridine kinase family protein n=1 Tax=Xenococcus sp. PCC 7305 TaxID=102125 RepID=UPI0002AC54F2|nr:hypothetical protein [Xenococcus sp. PCC 7305]ELS03914.1 uridine kinase [Xenococcus sp. PCC 7305]
MSNLQQIVEIICEVRRRVPTQRSVLVAISGIDGSGKGFIAAQLRDLLKAQRLNCVVINGDGWLNLPEKRFDLHKSPDYFYLNAFRFREMFTQLVLPLREHRSIKIEVDFVEETARDYRKHLYDFKDVDIILLEAIYLLQPTFISYYDLAFWIDCSFETALERALARAQEGLSTAETVKAYQTIYFPAQEIHFQQDNPQSLATIIINNDPKSKIRDIH